MKSVRFDKFCLLRKVMVVCYTLVGIPLLIVWCPKPIYSHIYEIIAPAGRVVVAYYCLAMVAMEVVPAAVIALIDFISCKVFGCQPERKSSSPSTNKKHLSDFFRSFGTTTGFFLLCFIVPILYEYLFFSVILRDPLKTLFSFYQTARLYVIWDFVFYLSVMICEEFTYRHIGLRRLMENIKTGPALILNALSFGILHVFAHPGSDWASISVDGLLFGLVYISFGVGRIRSLIAVGLFHIGTNISHDLIDGNHLFGIDPSRLSLILNPNWSFRPSADDYIYFHSIGTKLVIALVLYCYYKHRNKTNLPP